jgi:hypothetical protein
MDLDTMQITPEYGLLDIDYVGMKYLHMVDITSYMLRFLGSCEHEGTRATNIKLEESRTDMLDFWTLLYLCANCFSSQDPKRGD